LFGLGDDIPAGLDALLIGDQLLRVLPADLRADRGRAGTAATADERAERVETPGEQQAGSDG